MIQTNALLTLLAILAAIPIMIFLDRRAWLKCEQEDREYDANHRSLDNVILSDLQIS